MHLGDITTGEGNHRRLASVRGVGSDQDRHAGGLCLGESIGKIGDLVPRYFASVRIRKMSISGQHGYFAEARLDAHTPIGIVRPPDLDAWCMPVIGSDPAA